MKDWVDGKYPEKRCENKLSWALEKHNPQP